MGWNYLRDRESEEVLTNEEGQKLYSGDGPADRAFHYKALIDLHFRKAFDREPTKKEWARLLKFRTLEERHALIVMDDPRLLPVWLLIHETHAYEDGLWWGKFDRALDRLEWDNLYDVPGYPVNAWVELVMGIALKTHQEVMSLPMDVLEDIRLLDRDRRNSWIREELRQGRSVSLPTKEVTTDCGKLQTYVALPPTTPEAEIEFRNLVLEIFAP